MPFLEYWQRFWYLFKMKLKTGYYVLFIFDYYIYEIKKIYYYFVVVVVVVVILCII